MFKLIALSLVTVHDADGKPQDVAPGEEFTVSDAATMRWLIDVAKSAKSVSSVDGPAAQEQPTARGTPDVDTASSSARPTQGSKG